MITIMQVHQQPIFSTSQHLPRLVPGAAAPAAMPELCHWPEMLPKQLTWEHSGVFSVLLLKGKTSETNGTRTPTNHAKGFSINLPSLSGESGSSRGSAISFIQKALLVTR